MRRTIITETLGKIDQEVLLKGWVRIVRSHGKLIFLDLRDGSGTVQVVVNQQVSDEAYKTALELHPEFVIEVIGLVKKRSQKTENKKLTTGSVEIEAKKIKILAKAETLPFDMGGKDLNLELPTLLDHRGLTLRHPKIAAIFKVQETVIDSFRKACKEKGFTEFQSPVIIPQGAEGGSEVFEIKYFDHKAYLSQSPQFYKQIMVGVFEKIFTVNKTLRAEPSVTTRHLTEVTTLDAEFGFIDSWTDVMDMAEYVIKFMIDSVNKQNADVLKIYDATIPKVSEKIPRIKLQEAQGIIFKRTGRDNRQKSDLQPEDEREICKWSLEEKGSDLVFITHYPVAKRPFYTLEDPKDPGYTLSFDLIGRGTEWMTGGQRINDYDKLVENAKKRGIDLKKSEIYLQAFRYGMPPEGGFSFGSERITMCILGLKNIREGSLFPRDMERVDERFSH
ncbi:MAG: Aspartyl-tRNA synthetase [Candidatus Levybacteria bacterium GW2011_GWA1_37_16]|nr:MAG: Aspartyl-tRNA synthetase [Candidatus Levybacteria bacterium GW2011_GWA1_37_16]KKQ42027.1 MAG: Aspartyl-tRNA synthetase [Candidatus Levybacteria bacterium GW2011_GWB1_37_8]